jgi:hypothetical protein
MPTRPRNRTRRRLGTLHEEENLEPILVQAYDLAIGTYNGPVDRTIRGIVKEHMEESVIMSLGKRSPYNGNAVEDVIDAFLAGRDVEADIVRARYARHRRRGGGKRRRTKRSSGSRG